MTDPILSGTPESWTSLPVQTLFSLSKSELDSLQLHWAQTRFQQLQECIPALDALAE
ncbi:MAG: hypothetical protein QY306_03830 [Anaerolineales bacterium]|nr:MAG: hypothetical protein QY306_03830 [Anaerolineales bacterium]